MSSPPNSIPTPCDTHPLRYLPDGIHTALVRQCAELGIPHEGAVFILREGLFGVLGTLARLGATWRLLPGASECTHSTWRVGSDALSRRMEDFRDLLITSSAGLVVVDHLAGFAELTLNGERFILGAVRVPTTFPGELSWHSLTLIAGGTAASQRELVRRLVAAEQESGSIRFWTGRGLICMVPQVQESEVILPGTVKDPLFDWLDRFWRQVAGAVELSLPLHRGLLLLGAPGTGKTQLIRHILTRYPEREGHLFVATAAGASSDAFGRMVEAVGAPGRPKIVVLEDIDRLAEANVPQAHLLNALDGLFRAEAPTLWIATSNDPSGLPGALLDRPGRFDRVIVIPPPGKAERETMIRLFTSGRASDAGAEAAASAGEGLTGSHLREACSSALLASIDDVRALDELLIEELGRVRRQQADARSYLRTLSGSTIGFGTGDHVS